VANYTTNRIEGGTQFKCTSCEYSVSTLDFDAKNGSLRTQGATAINRHATQVHHQTPKYSSLPPQRRIRRTWSELPRFYSSLLREHVVDNRL